MNETGTEKIVFRGIQVRKNEESGCLHDQLKRVGSLEKVGVNALRD